MPCDPSDAEIIGSAADGVGLALLVARPGAIAPDAVSAALRSAGGADVRSVGGRRTRRSNSTPRRCAGALIRAIEVAMTAMLADPS